MYKHPVHGNSQAISSASTVSYQQHRDGNHIAAETPLCQVKSRFAAKQRKPSPLFTGHASSSAQPKSKQTVDTLASSSGTLEGNSAQVAMSQQSMDGYCSAAANILAALGSASLESDIRRAREVVSSLTEFHMVEHGKLVIYLAREVLFTEEILCASSAWRKRNY